jgi:predicted Zn finger-like uncharacterized protein
MSRITRCPACVTLFKVVPDQLRISEGWVRCGQCDEVFDASLHLLPEAPDAPLQSADPAPDLISDEGARPVVILEESALDPVTDVLGGENEALLAPSELESLPVECAPVDESPALPVDVQLEPIEVDSPHSMPEVLEPAAELSDVSFLRDQDSDSFWLNPWIRAALFMLGLVSLLALSAQVVVHERDRIAAAQPSLKPWLLALCAPWDCTLSPLHRIDAIVIESASFIKIRGDSYRLNFMVKNTGNIELALPAIELTLTDSSDQPVVRRVFLPTELGAKTQTLAGGAEWPTSLAVALKVAGDRVAGYRVLAFYP